MAAPLPIPGHSWRTKDRANPDLPQQFLMKKLPVRPNAIGQSRELKRPLIQTGQRKDLHRLIWLACLIHEHDVLIRKSSIYTQEVEC